MIQALESLCFSAGVFFSVLFVALTATSLIVEHLLAVAPVDSDEKNRLPDLAYGRAFFRGCSARCQHRENR